MRARLVIIALTSAALSGCGSSSHSTPVPTSSQTIANGTWVLAKYRAGATLVAAVPTSAATIAFGNDGKLTGSTGCNQFSGAYTVAGTRITMTVGPMTQRACTGTALNAQEGALTRQLPQVTSYRIQGATLSLAGSDGTDLFVYTHVSDALPGTSWRVTGVNNGKGAVASTALTENLTAKFDDQNTFNGFGGCSQLTGPYKNGINGSVAIGPLTSTKKTCGAAADQLQSAYHAALASATTYEVKGTTLTLRDSTNATQLTAQRS